MNDAFRMHHHVDGFIGEIKQPVGFDHFQSLVHHGGESMLIFPHVSSGDGPGACSTVTRLKSPAYSRKGPPKR